MIISSTLPSAFVIVHVFISPLEDTDRTLPAPPTSAPRKKSIAFILHSFMQDVHPQQSFSCLIRAFPCSFFLIRFPGQASIQSPVSYTHLDVYKRQVEFMGFAFCIAYLVFLIIYFKEFEEKQEFRQYSDLMELHLQSLQNEIDHVKNSERTLSILRHDMRHNLNIILTFLQNNNVEKAIDYIKGISDSYDDTVVKEYCSNDIINSVISMYDMRFRSKGFNLI